MSSGDNTSYVSVFSGRDITIDDKIIDGTHLFALFADITFDAKHATCEEDTIIEVTSIFSDVSIHVPHNVKVVLKGNPIFGDIKDKRRTSSGNPEGPTLSIRVLCLFGDVKIS